MASREISENATNFLGNMLTQGRPIPGQSLTNSPEQPYAWERPSELVNQREAVYEILAVITEPENLENILISIIKGVGIIDIASIMLYTGFIEGKWNPDLLMMLVEPTIYTLMALAEKANKSTPILFCHGVYDDMVPVMMGRAALDAMVMAGNPCEWNGYKMSHEVNM